MLYCPYLGVPPEYCEFVGGDLEKSKAWLMETDPDLYENLWVKREGADQITGKKAKKKVGFAADTDKTIRVIKMKRGGKKVQSLIIGLENWGCDIADVAKRLSKKLACGSQATNTDYKGITYECI